MSSVIPIISSQDHRPSFIQLTKELEEIMQCALSKEDYELAANIRDELEKCRLK